MRRARFDLEGDEGVFLKRHHDRVSLRKPQEMDILRMGPRKLQHWFSLWEAVMQKYLGLSGVWMRQAGSWGKTSFTGWWWL